jgi:glycosidase
MLAVCLLFSALQVKAAMEVSHVEPPYWWIEMQNPELQVMVYGRNLSEAYVSVSYPGVKVSRVELAENPSYLFVYLNIDKSAQTGPFDIVLTARGETKRIPYELRMREVGSAQRVGFSGDDVLYLVMPDRFVNGSYSNDYEKSLGDKLERFDQYARHGGDLAGIASRMGYLSNLGITTIALAPVVENKMLVGSYHGYAPTDFYKVDPRLGTEEELFTLVSSAHRRGLKVVLDMVLNHCGSRHPWLNNLPARSWLNSTGMLLTSSMQHYSYMDAHASAYDKALTADGWFARSMPDLNHRNAQLARYLIQNAIWWIESTGIDGIRLGMYPYADYKFSSEFCKAVMIEYPNFNIAGEAWYNKEASCAWWQRSSKLNAGDNSNLKTVMDFPLTNAMTSAFNGDSDNGLSLLYEVLSQDYLYPDPQNLLTFLDNIDISRFSKKGERNLRRYKQATAFLLTARGIPQITYGTEILMTGEKRDGDGKLCPDFPGGWKIDKKNAFMATGRTSRENEAFSYLQRLLTWRKSCEAVRRGAMKNYAVIDGVYAYARYTPRETVVVVLNGTNSPAVFNTVGLAELPNLRPAATDVITGRKLNITQPIKMAPRESLILHMR